MDDIAKLFTNFLGAVALIMALVLMVSILRRNGRRPFSDTLMMGALFSLALLYTMSDPIDLGDAGIFDMRGLLVGTAAALFGPMVGGITFLTGIVYRLMIGPPGLTSGLISVTAAYVAGLIYYFGLKDLSIALYQKSILLGLMITSQMLGIFAAPTALWGQLAATLIPYTLATNLLGVLLLSHLLGGEFSFLSEAETARRKANTDHLTGLLNRRGLEEVFPTSCVGNSGHRGRALLYFDVDHFKQVNDDHGHNTGDSVLRQIADQISSNLRPNDVFARLGGDEFAVVLNNIDLQEANHIAERCRKVVEEDVPEKVIAGLDVSISIGAVWMIDDLEINALLDQADKALYLAKAEGRNRVVFNHSDALDVAAATA